MDELADKYMELAYLDVSAHKTNPSEYRGKFALSKVRPQDYKGWLNNWFLKISAVDINFMLFLFSRFFEDILLLLLLLLLLLYFIYINFTLCSFWEDVAVVTSNTPVDPSAQYKNVVTVYRSVHLCGKLKKNIYRVLFFSNEFGGDRFQQEFSLAGGINLPKIIECQGSDGQLYKQVTKVCCFAIFNSHLI